MDYPISLILVAHGSRSSLATAEIQQFTAALNKKFSHLYRSCKPAFLEMASPSISDCVSEVYDQGVREVHLLPYFLSSGVHVTQDIPKIATELSKKLPQLSIKVLPAIGLMPEMADVVETMVKKELSHSTDAWNFNQSA